MTSTYGFRRDQQEGAHREPGRATRHLAALALCLAVCLLSPAAFAQNSLILSTTSLSVTEGQTATFTVRLSAAPTSNVTVTPRDLRLLEHGRDRQWRPHLHPHELQRCANGDGHRRRGHLLPRRKPALHQPHRRVRIGYRLRLPPCQHDDKEPHRLYLARDDQQPAGLAAGRIWRTSQSGHLDLSIHLKSVRRDWGHLPRLCTRIADRRYDHHWQRNHPGRQSQLFGPSTG